MNFDVKKIFACFLSLVILIIPIGAVAQVVPPMGVSVPTLIQAEVDEEFVIPVTITAGESELSIGRVRPRVTGLTISSQTLNRIVPPGTSINVVLTGIASEAGLYSVRIDIDGSTDEDGFTLSNELIIDVRDPDEDEERPEFKITQVSFEPHVPNVESIFSVMVDIENHGEEDSGGVTSADA